MQQKQTEKQAVHQVEERANSQGNEDKRKMEQNSYHNWFFGSFGNEKRCSIFAFSVSI